jgi:oligoribonuclease NrnB/cAMP/cGMP phosphodiesterase (DHH superfamily)
MISVGFFHKSDIDGHCSGAILKYCIPNIELIAIEHGDDFPWEKIKDADEVYMVDFSLPLDDMIKLAQKIYANGGEFIWIDHHKSAIERFEANRDKFPKIKGFRSVDFAACELTWRHLVPDRDVPRAVELLGKYDTWRKGNLVEWREGVVPYEYGMLTRETNPSRNMEIWYEIFDKKPFAFMDNLEIGRIIDIGKNVMAYLERHDEKNARRGAYLVDIDGLRGIAINSDTHSSNVLESVYKPTVHDVMVVYSHTQDQDWYVSLYSTKDSVDCSAIASKLAEQQKGIGGGHKGAAGMTVKKLPFEKVKEI